MLREIIRNAWHGTHIAVRQISKIHHLARQVNDPAIPFGSRVSPQDNLGHSSLFLRHSTHRSTRCPNQSAHNKRALSHLCRKNASIEGSRQPRQSRIASSRASLAQTIATRNHQPNMHISKAGEKDRVQSPARMNWPAFA